jgi:hypothetical protein
MTKLNWHEDDGGSDDRYNPLRRDDDEDLDFLESAAMHVASTGEPPDDSYFAQVNRMLGWESVS